MNILLLQEECRGPNGQIMAVDFSVRIEHSPHEGFDNEKLGQLETDLADFLKERINGAIKRGGAA